MRDGDARLDETSKVHRPVTSAIFLGASQALRLLLTILSSIVIARLLSPDDYGVVAMAGPVIGFITMFQDLGLSAATIQKEKITNAESNALFWINLLASIAIALMLLLVAPITAWFYGDVRAGYITGASALTVLINGCSMQQSALLNRHMRFGLLSVIDVANALVTFIVAAATALILHSYWALYFGTLVGVSVQTMMIWRFSHWRPSKNMALAKAKEMARFGGHVTGSNLLNFFVRNADNVIIARFDGAAMLGLYDRSYKLMMLPVQNLNAPVTRLLMPMLSRMINEPERYRSTFLFSVWTIMLALAPGVAIATALSNRLMPFLLGENWSAAGPIFFWLGLAGLVQPVANMTGVLFLTTGETARMMRWGVFSALVTIIGFFVGLQWGAIGVAASLFVTVLIRLPILFAICIKGTNITSLDLYKVQIGPIIGSGIGVGIVIWISNYLTIGPLLCLSIPMTYVLALVSTLFFSEGRATIFRHYKLVIDAFNHISISLSTMKRLKNL